MEHYLLIGKTVQGYFEGKCVEEETFHFTAQRYVDAQRRAAELYQGYSRDCVRYHSGWFGCLLARVYVLTACGKRHVGSFKRNRWYWRPDLYPRKGEDNKLKGRNDEQLETEGEN